MNTLGMSGHTAQTCSYFDVQVGDVSLVSKGQGFQELEHEALDVLNKK